MKKIYALIWFPKERLPNENPLTPFSDICDVLDEREMKDFSERLESMIDFILCEIKSTLKYDRENTANFFQSLISIGEPYLESYSELFRDYLQNIDAIKPRYSKDSHCTFSIYEYLDQNIKIENDCGLAELAEIRLEEDKSNLECLILNMNSISTNREDITILRDVHPEAPKFAYLPNVQTIKELYLWLKDNREPRIFTLHKKHGENGKNYWKSNKGDNVSPLLCSKEHAQDKLIEAIGDIRNNINDSKQFSENDVDNKYQLYWYDENHSRYIVFQRDNKKIDDTENSYHGYHIEEEQIRKEIPKEIKSKIDKIRNLLNED